MGARKGQHRVICENRRARHEYELDEVTEAGLILLGSEVKALRSGTAHLNDAWVGFEGQKPMLYKCHIGPFPQANQFNHEAERPRPLLLKATEVARLRTLVREKGLTLVPLKLYFDGPWAKLTFAIGRGRKNHDKRTNIREREDRQEIRRVMGR
jgi:SsrA-binding protein